MSAIIEQLVKKYENGQLTRRDLIVSLSALVVTQSKPTAQAAGPPLPARTLNHLSLHVSDVQRSLKFYQELFGLRPIYTRGATPLLQIGRGPEYITVSAVATGEKPWVGHFCFGIENFNPDRVVKTLAEAGIKARVMMQDGKVPLLYMHDPDNLEIQLQDVSYCGGSGPLGNVCP